MKEGFSLEVTSEKRNALFVAELYFKDLMMKYGVTDKRGFDLMIKIEVYTPSWHVRHESDVLSLYGYHFSAVLLDKRDLFSEKLCALLGRNRGRDIYDTLFLLQKKFAFNPRVLTANHLKGSPRELILKHLQGLPEKKLKYLADQVRPFLFKEDDAELVLKAPLYAEKFLKEYD